jgi:hypothetical protein
MLQNVFMSRSARQAFLTIPGFGAALLWVSAAQAALGGDAASIVADAAQIHGAIQSSTAAPVGTAIISADNGITVHEFLDSSGMVFAVRWSGPAVPDLQELLGRYFAPYTAVLATLPAAGRQRAIRVITADLVVLSAGHMRAYSGLAYLPQRIPPGVALESLR